MDPARSERLFDTTFRPVSLPELERKGERADGRWNRRARAKSIRYLFRSLDDVTGRVEDIRTRLNPVVRAWDRMTEADAKKLPPDVRAAWDAIVVAYEESDRSAHSEFYFPAEEYGALQARLEGAIYVPSMEGGGRFFGVIGKQKGERPEKFARFDRTLFQSARGVKWNDADRDAVLHSRRWDDLPKALDDERLERLRLLSGWSAKHWWSRGGMEAADWNELSSSMPMLAREIDLNCTRLERLQAALPNLDVLRERVPGTIAPVRSPGSWSTSSGSAGGTLSISARYAPGTDAEEPLADVIDGLQAFMKTQHPTRHFRLVMVPSRVARRLLVSPSGLSL